MAFSGKEEMWGLGAAGVILLAAAVALGIELGVSRVESRLGSIGPDCEIEVSNIVAESMATLVVNLKQKAPCDLAKLRDQAEAELERVSEE